MDLETALTTISVLEKQLEELESTSNEYEEELEATIERLKEELHKRDQGKESSTEDHKVVPRHVQITVLEIRIDELENENRSLKSQLQTLQEENDSILERNVLLQHELADVTNLIRVPRQHHPKELIQGGKIRVK